VLLEPITKSRSLLRSAYKMLVGKPEGMRQLGRPRHRSEDNIRMDLREIQCGLHYVAYDRDQWRSLVKTIMNFRIP
jgi:transposase